MIFSRTILSVCDNSGAKYVKALSIWGNAYRPYGLLCDSMLVVPKKLKKRKKKNARSMIQKRKKYIGLILSTRWNTRRRDGSFISFLKNSVILFSLKQKIMGSTIKIPLCKEIKQVNSIDSPDIKKLTHRSRRYI